MLVNLFVGRKAPGFDLPGVSGKNVSLAEFVGAQKAIIVVFTCNHCPYSIAYEERLDKMQSAYAPKGVAVIRINPDDQSAHPEDSLDEMKKRAVGKGAGFVYLRDEKGAAAGAYGVKTLPEVFLLDGAGVVRYAGRIDDCWQTHRRVRRHDLREALEDVLHGRDVAVKVTKPSGCALKISGTD
ncbi:MAG: thioredoxin family protein [Nitrospinae bacterium]|nr:thioredoxin family protein [Nitrospinota bacterium]